MNTDRSLHGLMRINRHRFIGSQTPIVVIPVILTNSPIIPIIPIPQTPPTGIVYTASDFGENAINNHDPSHVWHSEKNQVIFNYITRNFRNRCISYESYKTAPYNSFINDELAACKTLKADIIYTPYVDAARSTNTDNDNFILTVGSHYDNDGQFDNQVGTDNNYHAITPNINIFLSDSIAVSARRDTPDKFKDSTSEGPGMEFFEDLSPEGLDSYYPNADIPSALSQVTIDNSGTIMTTQRNPGFTIYAVIGEKITVRNTVTNIYEDTYIQEIIDANNIRVFPAVTPIINDYIYIWKYVTLSAYCGAQQESWAVPLVAGKLKVIKMSTGANWDTVRAAARATAKRNTTGIEEIDNVNWDIYRGFGCIDVQAAIEFINTNN